MLDADMGSWWNCILAWVCSPQLVFKITPNFPGVHLCSLVGASGRQGSK